MSVTKLFHYGAAALLFVIGVLGVAGVSLPGVTVDPVTALGAAIGVLTAGKLGPQS